MSARGLTGPGGAGMLPAMDDRRASRRLLSIVRGDWDEAAERAGDDAGFAALCDACDVGAWVHERLRAAGRADLAAPEELAALEAIRKRTRKDNLLLLAVAQQAHDLLREVGVVPVALKGYDVLHRLYPSFDTRTLDDVDLLVRRRELRRAIDAFAAAGWTLPPEPERTHYVRSSHHLPFASPGPLPVHFELHWNLAQDGRYSIDAEGLVDRARPLVVDDRTWLRLDDADLVAHLLVHHLSHYFDRRLKWLVDLGYVAAAPEFDWDGVARRVDAWGAGATAGVALAHLAKLRPDLIPAAALRAMPFARWRKLLTAPLRSRHPLELFRGTRSRRVQLLLAAAFLERPWALPGWLLHRRTRDRRPGDNPLDPEASRR